MTTTLLVGFAAQAFPTLALGLWTVVVARRRGGRWRWLPALPILGALAPLVGIGVTAAGLAWSFHAVAEVDPSEKAARLADGIAWSMAGVAGSVPVALLADLAALVGCIAGTVRSEGPPT